MFQVEGTRSVAVHPLEPATSAFTRAASGVLADNLDTLLGERLLPIRLRNGDEDEPYLLAVDAAGQPVVVEIVPVLDEVAVIRGLRFAGRAAGMSAQDFAAVYRGGPTRFAAHLAAFRETVPATTLLPTTVRSGARLLLVCSAIAEGVQEIVEFLLQPGWQVDILQVGVVPGADGARIVDVHPLTRTPPPRRAMEPTSSLRIVRHGDGTSTHTTTSHTSVPHTTGPHATGPYTTGSYATGPHGPAQHGPAPRGPDHQGQVHQGAASTRPATQPAPTVQPDPARRMPSVVAPPFAVRLADARGRDPYGAPDEHVVSPSPVVPPASLPYAFTGVAPAPEADGAHPDLALIASSVGAPAALVWSRDRRGEFYEALLHEDGWIELADGSWFPDPDVAAEAVSASDTHVDGWSVWRLERPNGPTLADLRDAARSIEG